MVLNMSKKKVFLLLISLVMMSLFANVVSASSHDDTGAGEGLKKAAETIKDLFGFIPEVLTVEKLAGGDAGAVFWAKFLVWILLFMVIFYGTGFVFKDNKNLQIGVAIAISLLGALGIPSVWILGMFKTYTLTASFIVFMAPVVAGLIMAHKIQFKLVKAVIYIVLVGIITFIRGSLTSPDSILDVGPWMPWINIIYAVVVIALVWNLATAWGPGEKFKQAISDKLFGGDGGGGGGSGGGGGTGSGGAGGGGAGGAADAEKEKTLSIQEIAVAHDAIDTLKDDILPDIDRLNRTGIASAGGPAIKTRLLNTITVTLDPQINTLSALIHREVTFAAVPGELRKMLGIHTKGMHTMLNGETDYADYVKNKLYPALHASVTADAWGAAKTNANKMIKVIQVLVRINLAEIKDFDSKHKIFP